MKINKCPFVCYLLISLFLTSCAQQSGFDTNDFFGKTWTLTTIDGESPTLPDSDRLMSIHFEQKTNRVYGYAGCNNYSGQYKIIGKRIKLTKLSTTRMLCRTTAKQESMFISNLENSNSFSLKNEQLQLLNNENITTLVFRKEQL